MPGIARWSSLADSGREASKSFAAGSEYRLPTACDRDRLPSTQRGPSRAGAYVTPAFSRFQLRSWGGLRSPLRGSISSDRQLEDEARGQGLSAFSPKFSMQPGTRALCGYELKHSHHTQSESVKRSRS